MLHAYPADLAAFVTEHWRTGAASVRGVCHVRPLPGLATLTALLSIAYQASLRKEEDRPVTFRLIVGEPADFPEHEGPPSGLHRLAFTEPRPLNVLELCRLSPAAKYHRALIGVRLDATVGLVLWGILQSGAYWLRDAHGGRRSTRAELPEALVVSVSGAGHVTVSRGLDTIAEIRNGILSRPSMDVFQSNWIADAFAEIRDERVALHEASRATAGGVWAPLDPDMASIIARQMLKRVIATMRFSHHGGLLLVLPFEHAQELARDEFLRPKYTFEDGEPRRRYRSLILRAMNAIAEEGGLRTPMPASVGFRDYESSTDKRIANLDEAILELSHLIGALADIDGAVVMTKRFEILGFGAEIRGSNLPDVLTVKRALDLEGVKTRSEPTDGVGTRHRAAYRLCQHVRDGFAVVASQDGGVRFVRHVGGDVAYWDHVAG